MKVYRIKHIPSGKYVKSTYPHYTTYSKVGHIYTKKCDGFENFVNNPDYEILYDEIKD